jgi:hypothetical protein
MRGLRSLRRGPDFRTTVMRKEYRNAPRERMGTNAWIRFDDGFSVRACVLADFSRSGVRLVVDEPHTVAARFSLLLKRDANPGRRCRVKWRRGREIGAEFI